MTFFFLLQIDIGNVTVNVMTKHSALLGMLTQSRIEDRRDQEIKDQRDQKIKR